MWIDIIQYDGGVAHWKNGSFFVLTSWLSIAWGGVLDCEWHHVGVTQFVRLKHLYIKLELHVKYFSFSCNHQSSTCCCCFHHFSNNTPYPAIQSTWEEVLCLGTQRTRCCCTVQHQGWVCCPYSCCQGGSLTMHLPVSYWRSPFCQMTLHFNKQGAIVLAKDNNIYVWMKHIDTTSSASA